MPSVSYRVTVEPASALPVKVGVWLFKYDPMALIEGLAGAVKSNSVTSAAESALTLPALSMICATRECVPSDELRLSSCRSM